MRKCQWNFSNGIITMFMKIIHRLFYERSSFFNYKNSKAKLVSKLLTFKNVHSFFVIAYNKNKINNNNNKTI